MGKLVIDLGHGGHDPGAIGPNKTHEADVVLAIGKELDELLKGYELEVKFTRLSNVYLSLSERAKIANDFKADYFLSIHINSATDSSVRGVEVWQYSNKNDKLNKFSNGLCEDVANIFNARNRGVKQSQKLSVLKNTNMPAALIEVDFISNVNAERDLNVSSNIKAVALVIRDNLIDLFGLEAVASDVLYKVCIGAFKDKNNAINQVKLADIRKIFLCKIIAILPGDSSLIGAQKYPVISFQCHQGKSVLTLMAAAMAVVNPYLLQCIPDTFSHLVTAVFSKVSGISPVEFGVHTCIDTLAPRVHPASGKVFITDIISHRNYFVILHFISRFLLFIWIELPDDFRGPFLSPVHTLGYGFPQAYTIGKCCDIGIPGSHRVHHRHLLCFLFIEPVPVIGKAAVFS